GLFGSNRPCGVAADVFLQEHEAIAFGAGLTGPRGPVRRPGRRSSPCEIEHDTAANHPDRLTVRASVELDLLIDLPLILDEARRYPTPRTGPFIQRGFTSWRWRREHWSERR